MVSKRMLAEYASISMMAAFTENNIQQSRRANKPIREITPPIPNGAKVWPEYGNVVAINEANAIRKYNKLPK
jgi:hypothetical protein